MGKLANTLKKARSQMETDKKSSSEYPQCAFFEDFGNSYGMSVNTCKGFAPWSCYRTQKEGKCRFGYRVPRNPESQKVVE